MSFLLEPRITVKEVDVSSYMPNDDYFKQLKRHVKKIGMSGFLKTVMVSNLSGDIYVSFSNGTNLKYIEPLWGLSEYLQKNFPKEQMKVKVWRFLHEG